MTGLLVVLLMVGLPLMSLLGDLCRLDLERSRALAEVALRRARQDPERDARDTSGAGTEEAGSRWGTRAGGEVEHGSLAAGQPPS